MIALIVAFIGVAGMTRVATVMSRSPARSAQAATNPRVALSRRPSCQSPRQPRRLSTTSIAVPIDWPTAIDGYFFPAPGRYPSTAPRDGLSTRHVGRLASWCGYRVGSRHAPSTVVEIEI